jgi:hypothetical protein
MTTIESITERELQIRVQEILQAEQKLDQLGVPRISPDSGDGRQTSFTLAGRIAWLGGKVKLPDGLANGNGSVVALIESLAKAAAGKSDADYQGEINRAMAFIPSEFFANDAWENAIGRMAAALANARG